MRQSNLFTKTRKEAPKDEVAKNAELLIRAGYIHKEMAGVYSYLPLGLRVLKKIENIIREEMNAIGGQEISMTALQDKTAWEKTGRWDDGVVDNWFKTKLKNGTTLGLGFTQEEPLTALMRDHVHSFRDLPVYAYQIQTKFRNEARAKSGIIRGREFLMKDLYSFSLNEAEHLKFYEKAKQAYRNIFNRVGIGESTYLTYASGGSFSKYSHEFQTVTDAGEDIIRIYIHKDDYGKGLAMEPAHTALNKELWTKDLEKELGLGGDFVEKKAVEVGNIFTLGTRFSEALDLSYLNEKGEKQFVFMGSYGIGPGRLMGTIVEVLSDEKGIVWPESVAPFRVHLISLATGEGGTKTFADTLYKKFVDKGVEVLYDDRNARVGEKFADSDLLGIPTRVVISDKTVAVGKMEVKHRTADKPDFLGENELIEKLTKKK